VVMHTRRNGEFAFAVGTGRGGVSGHDDDDDDDDDDGCRVGDKSKHTYMPTPFLAFDFKACWN